MSPHSDIIHRWPRHHTTTFSRHSSHVQLPTFEAQLTKRGRKRPVPVVPVVLYHGKRPWTAPTSFAEWMAIPPAAHQLLAPFLPDFRYILETRQPPLPDAYKGSHIVKFARLALDHARAKDFIETLVHWRAVIVHLEESASDQGIVPVLAMVINYVYRVRDNAVEPLAKALEAAGAPNLTEIVMNTYQQAIEKGKQLGLSEGEQIGLSKGKQLGLSEGKLNASRALLLRLCERRFGALSDNTRQRIEAADSDTLLVWAENIVVAATIDEVFGGPLT